VSESLKFAKKIYGIYKLLFIQKGDKGTWIMICLQLRACEAKPSTYPPF